MEEKSFNIDLVALLKAWVKRIWIVLIATVIAAVSVFIYNSSFVAKKYTSTTTLYVVNTVDYASTVSVNDLNAAVNLAQTYIKFITSRTTLEAVSKDVNSAYTASQLKKMVSVTTDQETAVLSVSVTCGSKSDAKLLADLVAEEGKNEIGRIIKASKVSVVDAASDAVLTSPNISRKVVVYSLIVFLLVSALIIFIELIDDRIKSAQQLKDEFGIDVIGVIPSQSGGGKNE
ncbi:MAG: YveK family protein [Acutalibacteraceae bacterium]